MTCNVVNYSNYYINDWKKVTKYTICINKYIKYKSVYLMIIYKYML